MEKYPYDNHDICSLTVQRYLGFSAIFFRFRTKLHSYFIPLVNMGELLVTGLIPCAGAGRLSWVGGYRLSHGLMKILRNAHGQRIGARSITYNDEKSKLSSITGKSLYYIP